MKVRRIFTDCFHSFSLTNPLLGTLPNGYDKYKLLHFTEMFPQPAPKHSSASYIQLLQHPMVLPEPVPIAYASSLPSVLPRTWKRKMIILVARIIKNKSTEKHSSLSLYHPQSTPSLTGSQWWVSLDVTSLSSFYRISVRLLRAMFCQGGYHLHSTSSCLY